MPTTDERIAALENQCRVYKECLLQLADRSKQTNQCVARLAELVKERDALVGEAISILQSNHDELIDQLNRVLRVQLRSAFDEPPSAN
jgi:hypothetical protein